MGITYKLKPEIRDFILKEKKNNPALSCRTLSLLIEEEFKAKISKSSINIIFKEAGLSMPIGRRLKKQRRSALKLQIMPFPSLAQPPQPEPAQPVPEPVVNKPIELIQEAAVVVKPKISVDEETTGAVLLKAADFLIGGINQINDIIRTRARLGAVNILNKTEDLLYSALSNDPPAPDLIAYLTELKQVTALPSDISRTIPVLFKEVRGVKVGLSSGDYFYLDSQFHTIWSTQHIPYNFSSTIYKIKSYIKRYFQDNEFFSLFMAPGFDLPANEFFDFMFALDSPDKKHIAFFSLYGNQFEELENIKLEHVKKQFFIFGLWPRQFISYRKVNKINEFRQFYFAPLKKEFFIAEIEMELSLPAGNKAIILRGCAVKTSPTEKIRLVILSNCPSEKLNLEQLCSAYFSHWPNLEEGLEDYSSKVEIFTYTATSERLFTAESLKLIKDPASDISVFFDNYLKVLDLFVRWNFLPAGYEFKDFSTVKEQFYGLPVSIEQEKDYSAVLFKPPEQYPYLFDLKYLCRRLNEQEISSSDGKRYWFSVVSVAEVFLRQAQDGS